MQKIIKKTNAFQQNDTILIKKYKGLIVPITLKFSPDSKGQILVLPGWNYPDTQWCSKTELCKIAKEKKYDLLFVEMQRSIYLAEYYEETRADYRKYPTRSWLMDSIVNQLLSIKLLNSAKPFFVMGLSTGGRGAAILALENPNLFAGAATLSGDFDPELQKDDPLMINSLGEFNKFPKRWAGDNNIIKRIKEFKVPIYIGHGKIDKVCPVKQSIQFAEAIKKESPLLPIKTNFPEQMGHDYKYWNSEVPSILHFFDELIIHKN